MAGMGFAEVDLSRAEEVCGGFYTMEGSLNWLLLHVPEERIPTNLGQINAGGGGAGGGAGGAKQKKRGGLKANRPDASKMSDAQKTALSLSALGFDFADCLVCVNQSRKQTVWPESLFRLFEWCKIDWHYRSAGQSPPPPPP